MSAAAPTDIEIHAPMTKSQGSSNHQAPKGAGRFGYSGLEFLWCLEFGIWILTPRALDYAQRLQKGLTFVRQLLLKSFCAIAIAAGPRFGAVFVTTIPARVRVLNAEKIEIFFPIRRSSASGGSQKQVSTQVATPSEFRRASLML